MKILLSIQNVAVDLDLAVNNMNIVYESKTGNVKRFCDKLSAFGLPVYSIDEAPNEPFVLITYTTLMGSTPNKTELFLMDKYTLCRGVASSGNRNWGNLFAKAADNISKTFGIPVLHKFELSGLQSDVDKLIEEVTRIANNSSKVD